MVPGRLFKVETDEFEWIYWSNQLLYIREKWKCGGVSGSSIEQTLAWSWHEVSQKLVTKWPNGDLVEAPPSHQEAYQQWLARSVLLPPPEDSP